MAFIHWRWWGQQLKLKVVI